MDFTVNTQPAIFLISYSILCVIKNELKLDLNKGKYFAGHSLGNTRFVMQDIRFSDTLKILESGEIQCKTLCLGQGGGCSIGTTVDVIEKILTENKENIKVQIANDNSEGQMF